MEEIIELKEIRRPKLIINNDIDDSKVMFPEKLKAINEMFEKHPLPAEFYIDTFSKTEQEHGFDVSGVLKRADVDKNTFLVIEMDGLYEINYHIRTMPETLNQLVKAFLNKPIKVHIRPQINADNLFEYELIEVKVD